MDSIAKIKEWAEEIEASWDGKDSGRAEDNSHAAKEILEKIKEIEELINEINDF